MLENIPLETALQTLLPHINPLTSQFVPIAQGLGRILAADMLVTENLPATPRAAMDGYALRADDLNHINSFQLVGTLKHGDIPGKELGPGQTMAVATGGPLPPGAGAVVPWEKVRLTGQQITLSGPVAKGSCIKPMGEDFTKGELIASCGTVIDPGHIGVLAALGHSQLPVLRLPQVAIISLGPEVVPTGTDPKPGQVWDSNGPLLAALVARDGGQVVNLTTATAANNDGLPNILQKLLTQADMLLTVGGTAAGSGDDTLATLQQMQANVLFWGVDIKPGSHTGVTFWQQKPIITLSGNPAACAVGYHLLAAPALRAMQGQNPQLTRHTAILNSDFNKKSGTRRLVRGRAFCEDGGRVVEILPGQKSSMLRSLMHCNALIDLPAGHSPLAAGAKVNIINLTPGKI